MIFNTHRKARTFIRNIFIAAFCLLVSAVSHAQNGWLPPVHFPQTTGVCDSSSWKLVFYDDFKDTTLSSQWIKYITWDGMTVIRNNDTNNRIVKTDHADWSGARICKDKGNAKVLFKDENVQVNNGTCKILLKYDPGSSWSYIDSTSYNYPARTFSADYSTGVIAIPFQRADGSGNWFNSGKFEAAIRFPDFKGAWCAFWTWHGAEVNEIDIAEMWGGAQGFPFLGDRTRTDFNLHAWRAPDPPPPAPSNPYNLPDDAEPAGTGNYPGQSWANWIWGTNFKTGLWHTYTCEWDTASIKSYVDGRLFNTFWKYSSVKHISGSKKGTDTLRYSSTTYPVTVGSGCNIDSGNWHITYGYPYSSKSESHLRLSGGFGDNIIKPNNYNTPQVMGIMEIDNVKIWQRHPEKGNHSELCSASTYPPPPSINGPDEVCGIASYTLDAPVPGNWSAGNNIFQISNETSGGVTLSKQTGTDFNAAQLTFSYGNGIAGCPAISVTKPGLYCNQNADWNIMIPAVMNNKGEGCFHFISELYHRRDVTGGTTPIVEWNIAINSGQDYYDKRTAVTYNLKGQYASSPSFQMAENKSYNLKWTIKVTDASGTHIRTGERNSQTTLLQQKSDNNTYYVNAYIDKQEKYDKAVYYGISKQMISEEEFANALFVDELIEKVKADALEPYLIIEGVKITLMNTKRR